MLAPVLLIILLNLFGLCTGQQGQPESVEVEKKFWTLVKDREGNLPLCAERDAEDKEVAEVCNIIQAASLPGEPSIGFQYCACKSEDCSAAESPDDAYTILAIGDLVYKTCQPRATIPTCTGNEFAVAKIWYGEELPLRVLNYCSCPQGTVWGETPCTSSGRICFVVNCQIA